MRSLDTDILIIGAGDAGLSAALRVRCVRPDLDVTIVTKAPGRRHPPGVLPPDAVKRRFMASVERGGWLNDQELLWTFVNAASRETEPDSQPDVRTLERHRVLDLIAAADGSGLAGALALDMRSGEAMLIRTHATLLATGRNPDGMAMALRAGVPLRDMEIAETGGVRIAADGVTAIPRLYAAGDVTGGLHGAARLDDNAIAAAVLGAVAGECMAEAVRQDAPLAEPHEEIMEIAYDRAFSPLRRRRSDLPAVRQRLEEIVANEMGPSRSLETFARARHALNNLASGISGMGVPDPEPRNNGVWMERLDLENLILMTRAVCGAMQARFAETAAHRFTTVRSGEDERIDFATEPVEFTRVKPGETLLSQAAE